MRAVPSLLTASFLFAACGASLEVADSSAAPPPGGGEALDFTSGGRLLAYHLRAEGAEPLLLGVVDAETGHPCRFVHATDGKRRCLPVTPALEPSGELFVDADCQVPLLVATEGDAPIDAPHVSLPQPGCDRRYEVRGLARFDPDQLRLFARNGGACQRTQASTAPRGWVPGPPIPPERWVEGLASRTTGTEGIAAEEIRSADGGRFRISLVDPALGAPCVHVGSGVCFAQPAWVRFSFADARCSAPLAEWADPRDECGPPPYIMGSEHRAYEVGQRWEGAVFVDAPKGPRCAAAPPAPGVVPLYTLGRALPQPPAAPIQIVVRGTDRLALLVAADRRAVPVAAAPLAIPTLGSGRFLTSSASHRDRATGEDCTPVRSPRDGVRCVPSGLRRPLTANGLVQPDPEIPWTSFSVLEEWVGDTHIR